MSRKWLAAPYVLWMIGFTVIPLVTIVIYAFGDGSGGFTLDNVLAIFQPIYRKALIQSLQIGLACTGLCLLIAYPLTLVLRRLNFSKQGFIVLVVLLPMWMNFILRVLAWQMILSQNGILNMILGWFGLGPLQLANTPTAVMIGMVYEYLPFMILPIYNALMEIDDSLLEAARDLGAGSWRVFWRVIFPMTLPGAISGVTMVFVPSMTTFVVANILGGGKVQLIGNIIEHEFITGMNWNLGSGLSVALMVFILISMGLVQRSDSSEKGSVVW